VPFARYVSTLRDPVDQVISWEYFALNTNYRTKYYPSRTCSPRDRLPDSDTYFAELHPQSELLDLFDRLTLCEDIVMRKKVSMQLMAHRIVAYQVSMVTLSFEPTSVLFLLIYLSFS
jgi:hypothetical protein